mgnify:CR=1 FL=1
MLCIAVLSDTFIVRTLMVPAIMHIAGHINWWPGQHTNLLRLFAISACICNSSGFASHRIRCRCKGSASVCDVCSGRFYFGLTSFYPCSTCMIALAGKVPEELKDDKDMEGDFECERRSTLSSAVDF